MKTSFLFFIIFAYSSLVTGEEPSTDQLLSQARKLAPEVHEELVRLQKSAPVDFAEELVQLREALAERDRVLHFSKAGAEAYWQMYRIDFEAVWYSDEIASTKDEKEIAELRNELQKLIEDSFDQWVIYERAKLEKVRRDLELAEAELAQHEKDKKAIVEEDTDALIEESREYLRKKK